MNSKRDWVDAAGLNEDVRKFENFIEDVGYNLANLIGIGERANEIVNWLKSMTGSTKTMTLNVVELTKYLKDKFGTSVQQLQKVLTYLDKKIGSLPAAQSQVMKKAIRQERSRLVNRRTETALALDKVDRSMNTALGMAGQQEYFSPSRKLQNQRLIGELTENSTDLANSIERKINNV